MLPTRTSPIIEPPKTEPIHNTDILTSSNPNTDQTCTDIPSTSNINSDIPSSSHTVGLGFVILFTHTNTHTSSNTTTPQNPMFNDINLGNKERIEAIVEQILNRVSIVPSKIQLEQMLNAITEECNAGIKDTATGIQRSLLHIAQTATKVLEEMSKEFSTKINKLLQTIIDNLKRKDELYFK